MARLALCSIALACFVPAGSAQTLAPDRTTYARAYRQQLVRQVMPYWYDTAVDTNHGGYLLADDVKGRGVAKDKQLVTQSRMVWGFSHACRNKLGDGQRDYLKAAQTGYRFLLDHFLDQEQGGYFWKSDLAGKPIHDCKFLYGEAFVIYAFVEYHRASGEPEPLQRALELYRVLQKKCHDEKNGGWVEHTERDWRPLPAGDRRGEVEVVGLRSANAHLHWMEALAELYDATQDADVRKSLEEALRLNMDYFYPKEAGRSCFHRQPDWSPATGAGSAGLSYGHNVEFAWLMIRAEEVLGRKPSWGHFEAHLDHALKYGYDHKRGGLYHRGEGNQPATDTQKIWWVQAEMLAALTDALRHQPNAAYADALDKLLRFVSVYMVNQADGVWLESVTPEGKPFSTAKAHNWKANYHDVRGMVKFIEAFEGGSR